MSDYCKCKNCKYLDTSERKSYKYYCEWYMTYEDADKLTECKHYRED